MSCNRAYTLRLSTCMHAPLHAPKCGSLAPLSSFTYVPAVLRILATSDTKRRGEWSAMRATFPFLLCALFNAAIQVCRTDEGGLSMLQVTGVSENSAALHWEGGASKLAKGKLKVTTALANNKCLSLATAPCDAAVTAILMHIVILLYPLMGLIYT